jgi:GT2 family glycosyltransferase
VSEPLFSIIIATYRRPDFLAACLQALTRLDYPREQFEVIVVDDDGGLREEDVAGPLRGQPNVLFLRPAHGGPAGARNAGAARARGTYLYFVDDDCRPAPDCLVRLRARTERHPGAAIVGLFADANPRNLWSAASQAQLEAVVSYYNRDTERATFGAGGNLAVPAEGFRAVGGFDASLWYGEDREFLDRWLRRGQALVHAAELVVVHNHPTTLRAFWRRNTGYGRGAFLFAQRLQAGGGSAPHVDWSFYRHLFTFAIKTHRPRPCLVTAAVLLARVGYSCGYLAAKRQHLQESQSVSGSRW